MSIKWILLLTVLFLSATGVVVYIGLNPEAPAPTVAATPPPVAKKPEPAPPAPPPKPDTAPPATTPPAATPQAAAPAPVPEVEQSDEEIEREQVAAALAQLASAEAAQRVEGAEQLGAYPTKEAEVALTNTLGADADADVRNAAAQSLGYVEKPTESTLSALLSALEDQNEDVRLSALSTLEDFMLGSDEGSKRYKMILGGLKSRQDTRSIPQDTREAIHDILQDQSGSE
ncbi:HEAT repeat domain-containing protein [Methylomagnum sp.]